MGSSFARPWQNPCLDWSRYSSTNTRSPHSLALLLIYPRETENRETAPDCRPPKRQNNGSPTFSLFVPTWGSAEPFGQPKVLMNVEMHRILEYFALKVFPAATRVHMRASMGHPRSSSTNPTVEVIRKGTV